MNLRGKTCHGVLVLGIAGASLTNAIAGCGGHVDLGRNRSSWNEPQHSGGAANDAAEPSVGRALARFEQLQFSGSIALFGDLLFFGAVDRTEANPLHSLYRCDKSDCAGSLERLSDIGAGASRLQVSQQKLGFSYPQDRGAAIATCDLPRPGPPQVVIGQLPDGWRPLFHDGFVFWPSTFDSSIYRCALPTCAGGPQRVGPVSPLDRFVADGHLSADGELLFSQNSTYVYRAAEHGAAEARRLWPDEQLSDAPDPSADEAVESPRIATLVAGNGSLYAALSDAIPDPRCVDNCTDVDRWPAQNIVRWPVGGGPRQLLIRVDASVEQLFFFGEELVWVELGQSEPSWRGTLRSCRIDACEATRRALGTVTTDLEGIAADDRDFYWVETDRGTSAPDTIVFANLIKHQINRAPRLPSARE